MAIPPLELRRQIIAELNKPGFADHFMPLKSEQRSRQTLESRPVVVTWEDDPSDPKSFGLKPPAGSVTMYWALKNSSVLKQLEYAHVAHDVKRLGQLHGRLARDYESRKVISVEEASLRMRDLPSFFDFRYGKKLLAGYLWLEGAEAGSMVFPYNGGRLDLDEFSVVEYLTPRARSGYDVLVVVNPPKLSKIEKIAVETVAGGQSGASLDFSAALCFAVCALVTIAVFVTVNTAVTTCCDDFHDRLAQVSLPPEVLERIGAVASAKELLEMRQRVFEEFGVM